MIDITYKYKIKGLLVSLLSGLLLFAAWPVMPFTFLIFLAWVPLLWLEMIVISRRRFLAYVYFAMIMWNVATTWWIWNASAPGAIGAFLANSFIMCLPWVGYKTVKRKLGQRWGYISLVAFWMCFEYIHLTDWGLSWPWLTLGNVFATKPYCIQWYEFTGTSGGTLWVLLTNILLFDFFVNTKKNWWKRKAGYCGVALLVLPIVFSYGLGFHLVKRRSVENIVVVQPNIDPYEKVSGVTGGFESQLQKLIKNSESKIDNNTSLVVWPETALYMSNGINEAELAAKSNFLLNPLWDFLQRHPQIKLFTGVESFNWLENASKQSKEFNGQHYEAYNGAALLDSSGALAFYHKSMLVPGVETLPWFLKFIDSWFEKFGGTTAGYAKQKERTVIDAGAFKIAPSICYESIYGDYMRKYVKNGANLICIITNDGWWKNTPGHKQHMNYARLRAIETRRWVARSANTGISCFIDPYGNVNEAQPYDTEAAIKMSIAPPGDHKTFFVRYGDVLSKLMMVLSAVIIAMTVCVKFRKVNIKKVDAD